MAEAVSGGGPCPFRALSIDGGGMRGIYTASYLDGVATAFAKRRDVAALDIGAGFDLLVGTSTGAIIASALAIRVSPARIVELYRQHGKLIFRRRIPSSFLGLLRDHIARPKALEAGERALRAALDQVFGDFTIGKMWHDRKIALCVPALEMSQHRAWVFKTPHLATSFARDDDSRLTDVCLATSAAPLYRSLARFERPSKATTYFADGGLWANNPVLVALTESIQMLSGQTDRPLEIFSLGTCPRPEGTFLQGHDRHFSLSRWRFGSRVAALSIDAQESAFDFMAKLLAPHLDRKCQVVRFPRGPVPADLQPYLDLDETSEHGLNSLVAQATADVNATLSACGRTDDPSGAAICRLFESMPVLEAT